MSMKVDTSRIKVGYLDNFRLRIPAFCQLSLIVADLGELTISADIEYLDFEDFEDNYSCHRATPGAQGLATARTLGHLYYFHTGQTVTGIHRA
jgi:hypothetical protein